MTYLNVYGNEITNLLQLDEIESDKKQTCVKKGDVFFTTSSETPEEVGLSSVLIEDLDETYLNSFCFGYRMNTNFDLYFLSALFRSGSFRKKVILLGQGISRYNLSKKKMMNLEINYPRKEEQLQIGMLFYKLSLSITLYQR